MPHNAQVQQQGRIVRPRSHATLLAVVPMQSPVTYYAAVMCFQHSRVLILDFVVSQPCCTLGLEKFLLRFGFLFEASLLEFGVVVDPVTNF